MPIPLALASVIAGALALMRTRPFRVEVGGTSMEPTLAPSDYLVATRSGRLRRGALVVIERPGQPGFELVKRIAGLPGDVIDGRVLELNQYWVVGESTGRSTDSRAFGPVTQEDIKGIVRLRYWPPSRFRWFVNR